MENLVRRVGLDDGEGFAFVHDPPFEVRAKLLLIRAGDGGAGQILAAALAGGARGYYVVH